MVTVSTFFTQSLFIHICWKDDRKRKRLKLLLDAFFQKRNQTTRLETDKLKIFLKSILSPGQQKIEKEKVRWF